MRKSRKRKAADPSETADPQSGSMATADPSQQVHPSAIDNTENAMQASEGNTETSQEPETSQETCSLASDSQPVDDGFR